MFNNAYYDIIRYFSSKDMSPFLAIILKSVFPSFCLFDPSKDLFAVVFRSLLPNKDQYSAFTHLILKVLSHVPIQISEDFRQASGFLGGGGKTSNLSDSCQPANLTLLIINTMCNSLSHQIAVSVYPQF